MDKTELSVKQLLISKWLVPAYVFLGIGILILVLEISGVIKDTGVIAMNLFTVSFLTGMLVPILIQIYVKLSEISVKIA